MPTEIRCSACGRSTTNADRYCGFCGARLDVEGVTPTGETTGPDRPHVDRILGALRSATIGEYDIAGEIGRGGMAVVFLAYDLSLNRKVAIKALLPELLYTEGMDRRFKHEARIAAKLDHPNILVIHSVREANDLLFIVMKLVEGLPLSAVVKTAGPLPIPVVRLILRHVAEALAYAHGEGVVHRDVKPANIMVDRRGNVVVMDFGIAKAADDAHLTRTGLVIGTPAYMSPEQCLAHAVSPASDQYSLGVLAYELLTGRTPFRGSPLEMQWAHATAAAPTVRSVRPDCPAELDALVLRMLAKAPADRWASLDEVAHALGDDPATASAARATLVALANEAPGLRDGMPTTPASPLPFGHGPAAVLDATTDPLRRSPAGATPQATPVAAAGLPDTDPVAAPMLTLSQQRIELATGDAVELIVELDANEAAVDGTTVLWESSDPGVAAVSPDGFVTAVAPGLAEIACVWRGRRAVCVVHVSGIGKPESGMGGQPPAADGRPYAAAREQEAAGGEPGIGREPEAEPSVAVPRRALRKGWVVGVIAAGIVAATAIYRALPSAEDPATTESPTASSTASATAAVPEPPSAPAISDSVASPTPPATPPAAGTGDSGVAPAPNAVPRPRTTPPAAVSTAENPPGRVAGAAGAPASGTGAARTPDPRPGTAPPASAARTVDAARLDTTRLTANRADTAGYDASRATPALGNATPPAPRDSAADRLPAPSREIATALFQEFASVVNTRAFTRITSAYSQPSDPAAVRLWQEFLIFVRDYTPRATVRSTTVDATTNPPTITASIDFRWAGDSGFDRTRSASFVGIGVPITDGWQLRGVRLARKFW